MGAVDDEGHFRWCPPPEEDGDGWNWDGAEVGAEDVEEAVDCWLASRWGGADDLWWCLWWWPPLPSSSSEEEPWWLSSFCCCCCSCCCCDASATADSFEVTSLKIASRSSSSISYKKRT